MHRFVKQDAVPAVVVDAGSHSCKAGFAGMHVPKIVFRTDSSDANTSKTKKSGFVGRDHHQESSLFSDGGVGAFRRPIRRGIVMDWDRMEAIWERILFRELKVNPRSHPVLLSETALSPAAHRERTVETMFETFAVPALGLAVQPHLALYSSGRVTGIVQECGSDVTQTMAIYDNRALSNGVQVCEYGGRDLTNLLGRLMARKTSSFSTALAASQTDDASEFLRQVKEAFCYVSMDFDKDMSSEVAEDLAKRLSLPDGRLVTVAEERFKCAESLFTPAFLGLDCDGVHQAIHRTLIRCDSAYHRSLYRNVVLSGGSSLVTDFAYRMRRELCVLAGPNDNVRVIAPPCIAGRRNIESWKRNSNFRKLAVWIGGSLLASSPQFEKVAITKAEYAEFGTSVVHRKSH